LDVEYDLSKVHVCVHRQLCCTPFPQPLQDRMEILRLPGYTEQEKFGIAKRFLVKARARSDRLTEKNLKFTDEGLLHMIDTHEAEFAAGARDQTSRQDGAKGSDDSPPPAWRSSR